MLQKSELNKSKSFPQFLHFTFIKPQPSITTSYIFPESKFMKLFNLHHRHHYQIISCVFSYSLGFDIEKIPKN